MKTYKSESDTRPSAWDKTSSEHVVYHNYNVEEVPATEEKPLHYVYDVDEYSNKEFIALMDDIVAENTDAIIELAEIIGG